MRRQLEHAERRRRESSSASRPVRRSALVVGRADDPAEADADRFADELIASLRSRPSTLFRAAPGNDVLGGHEIGPELDARIVAASHGGSGVPTRIRRAAQRHGGDLAGVRLHTGRDAGALSRTLQAEAFTIGRDVFLGDDAPRPGSVAGDHLLAHELGHVAAEPASRVRRRFGSSKPKPGEAVTTDGGQVELANGLSNNDRAERQGGRDAGKDRLKRLRNEVALLESALRKLTKGRLSGAGWDTAEALGDKAETILASLPAADSKKAQQMLGVALPAERRRLVRIVDEVGLILDERRVAETKRAAGGVYMDAGRNADDGAQGFTKLTPTAQATGFGDVPAPDPDPKAKAPKAARIRDAGANLGLSPAEIAAIFTFTAEDYQYINPATANNDAWMKAANPRPNLTDDERTTDLKARKEEGALHAGMAVQGLAKLPVWAGRGYRGEALAREAFEGKFKDVTDTGAAANAPRKFKALTATFSRPAIASVSKELQVAQVFVAHSGGKIPLKKRYGIIYVLEVTNGRDIEPLSNAEPEREVVTLPGATFKIYKVEAKGAVPGAGMLYVYCKQVH